MKNILFEEKQYFRQWWLWLIMLFIAGDVVWQMVNAFREIGKIPLSDAMVDILLPLIPLTIVLLFKFANLHTTITHEGIYVKFFPFHRKFRFYPWEVIKTLSLRKYSPIAEYRGWGLRRLGSNMALNVSGDKGLQLKFTNDSKLLIGTMQVEKMSEALSSIKKIPFEAFAFEK